MTKTPIYHVDTLPTPVTSTGLSFLFGGIGPCYIIVANNTINSGSTGIGVSLSITPSPGPTFVVPYGQVKHYFVPSLVWFSVNGNGANVSVLVSDTDVPLEVANVTVNVPSSIAVTGTVATTGLTAVKFANGGTAAFYGKITATMVGTGAEITVSINGGAAAPISATIASGTVVDVSLECQNASTYTFAGGTFVAAIATPLGTT